ncbi:MAG: RCC1 domain-containing protein [Comamonas sp.]
MTWTRERLYMLSAQVQENTGAPAQALATDGIEILQWFPGLQSLYGLTLQGQLYAWGASSAMPLHSDQQGPVSHMQQLPVPAPVKTISTGMSHALALNMEGQLWTWGANGAGQLGTGNLQAQVGPQRLKSHWRWVAIAAGVSHSLALDTHGQLWGWGSNHQHQLSAQWSESYILQPQKVAQPAGLQFVSVHAGLHLSAAVTEEGDIWVWGINSLGQLGQGHTQRMKGMQRIQDLPSVRQLSIGHTHMLALDNTGIVWAWGDNRHGTCQGVQVNARAQMRPHAVSMPSAFSQPSPHAAPDTLATV